MTQELAGLRIAAPRTTERPTALVEALRARGAQVYDLPLSRLELLDRAPLVEMARTLDQFTWVLLAAPLAVQQFDAAVAAAASGAVLLTRKLAVAGAATVESIVARQWTATVQVDRGPAELLLDAMATRGDVEGHAILYPAVIGARDPLPEGLRALGGDIHVVPVCRHSPDPDGVRELRSLLAAGAIDMVTASTPGVVDALLDAVAAEQTRRVRLACIGPMTARAARTAGFPVVIEAATPTTDALVRSIVASVQRSR